MEINGQFLDLSLANKREASEFLLSFGKAMTVAVEQGWLGVGFDSAGTDWLLLNTGEWHVDRHIRLLPLTVRVNSCPDDCEGCAYESGEAAAEADGIFVTGILAFNESGGLEWT